MVGSLFADWKKDSYRWALENKQPPLRFDPVGCETYKELKHRVVSFCKVKSEFWPFYVLSCLNMNF